jgi:hypothetical protein
MKKYVGLLLLCVAVLALRPSSAVTQVTAPVVAQPVLGSADAETVLMGSAPGGEPGEAWGYRQLPLDVGGAAIGDTPLEFGDPGEGNNQLAFLRYTRGTGWYVAQTPLEITSVEENGVSRQVLRPYRGFSPIPNSARITEHGGGILIGNDVKRGQQGRDPVVLLERAPGGRFTELPVSPAVLESGESLADVNGLSPTAVAAFERDGRSAAFIAAKSFGAESAVLYFDGESWSREPVALPAGSEGAFDIVAIDATGPDNAWMLARPDDSLQRGVTLFQRVTDGGPHWIERDIGNPLFSARQNATFGISGIDVPSGDTRPISVTSDGVWIDGRLTAGSGEERVDRSFTLFFDPSQGALTGSWCDVTLSTGPLCTFPFGARFGANGYRSFAWPGPGYGSRIITNPLDVGGGNGTNRGTYLRLDGNQFTRVPGAGGNFRESGAFSSPDEGWIEGPVHVTREPEPLRLGPAWPLSLRAPLTSIASAPGSGPDLGGRALAVGMDGGVARYAAGSGWTREFLLSSNGAVVKAGLRGVAWPEPARAHAVGDLGAMWLWRAETGLWEKDPAAPVGFEGNLMDVAFDPRNPERGYAVGKGGVLLRYDKTWIPEPLPAAAANSNLSSISFAGSQALVAAGPHLLVNDGGGWRVDAGADALLDSLPSRPDMRVAAGLPDGGVVVAGTHVVLERDGFGHPWRLSGQPLPSATAVAAAAYRDGGRVRAILSTTGVSYPPSVDPEPQPGLPPPVLQPYPPSGDGYVLRETPSGWRDEQHMSFASSGLDKPIKADPVLDFLLDANGNGWTVGGWSGDVDNADRGIAARTLTGKALRQAVQTSYVSRYGSGAEVAPPIRGDTVPLAGGPARFAFASHAQCEQPCAGLAGQGIGPDRGLEGLLGKVAGFGALPGGPRMLLYGGGRLSPGAGGLDGNEAFRFAQELGSQPGLPVFNTVSAGDLAPGGLGPFTAAFEMFNAPFGRGPAPPGVDASGVPGAAPASGARTHYAFDSHGSGGVVRVIVIDNSSGSLAASDPHQNPPEQQAPWLQAALADARAKQIPSIVIGSRDLNTRFSPRLNIASDGDEVARMLVEGGASAYFFERPEENRAYRIPAGGADTIPTFGSGTVSYRSPVSQQRDQPDALFGDAGFLLAEVNAARRNPTTNRAPVSARLIPLIEDVSLLPLDGTLLRRSRPALFQGIGRRPRAGDRWGRAATDGTANPPGGDPYVAFPPAQCLVAGCSARLAAEYEFISSDPDIADFVKQDPNSSNLRKPYIGPGDKVVSDSSSGLVCTFNAGTATLTIRAGGVAYSQTVRVLPGSVQRPCGTRPLNPSRFRRAAPRAAPPAPPPPAPQGSPPVEFTPPPPPPAPAPPAPPPANPPNPPTPSTFLPPLEPIAYLPPVPLPTPPPAIRPSPPSGGLGRAYQVEEKREEEAAPEESQASARYIHADHHALPPGLVLAVIVFVAFAGASIRGGGRGRARKIEAAVVANREYEATRNRYRRGNIR